MSIPENPIDGLKETVSEGEDEEEYKSNGSDDGVFEEATSGYVEASKIETNEEKNVNDAQVNALQKEEVKEAILDEKLDSNKPKATVKAFQNNFVDVKSASSNEEDTDAILIESSLDFINNKEKNDDENIDNKEENEPDQQAEEIIKKHIQEPIIEEEVKLINTNVNANIQQKEQVDQINFANLQQNILPTQPQNINPFNPFQSNMNQTVDQGVNMNQPLNPQHLILMSQMQQSKFFKFKGFSDAKY